MYPSSYSGVPELLSPFAVTGVSDLLSHLCHMSPVPTAESFPQSGISVGGKKLREAVMAGNE